MRVLVIGAAGGKRGGVIGRIAPQGTLMLG